MSPAFQVDQPLFVWVQYFCLKKMVIQHISSSNALLDFLDMFYQD